MVVLLFCRACRALRTPSIADVYNVRASGSDSSQDTSDSSVLASSASPSYCRLLLRLVDFLVLFLILGFEAALDAFKGAFGRDRERLGLDASGDACLVASAHVSECDCDCVDVAAASHLDVRRRQLSQSQCLFPVATSQVAPISRRLQDHLRMNECPQLVLMMLHLRFWLRI